MSSTNPPSSTDSTDASTNTNTSLSSSGDEFATSRPALVLDANLTDRSARQPLEGIYGDGLIGGGGYGSGGGAPNRSVWTNRWILASGFCVLLALALLCARIEAVRISNALEVEVNEQLAQAGLQTDSPGTSREAHGVAAQADGRHITLLGSVVDNDRRELALNTARKQSGVSAVSDQIDLADDDVLITEASIQLTSDNVVTLTGSIGSEADRRWVLASLETKNDNDNNPLFTVVDQLQVAPDLPEWWREAMSAGVSRLSEFSSANIQLDDQSLVVTGHVDSPLTANKIVAHVAGVIPEAVKPQFDIVAPKPRDNATPTATTSDEGNADAVVLNADNTQVEAGADVADEASRDSVALSDSSLSDSSMSDPLEVSQEISTGDLQKNSQDSSIKTVSDNSALVDSSATVAAVESQSDAMLSAVEGTMVEIEDTTVATDELPAPASAISGIAAQETTDSQTNSSAKLPEVESQALDVVSADTPTNTPSSVTETIETVTTSQPIVGNSVADTENAAQTTSTDIESINTSQSASLSAGSSDQSALDQINDDAMDNTVALNTVGEADNSTESESLIDETDAVTTVEPTLALIADSAEPVTPDMAQTQPDDDAVTPTDNDARTDDSATTTDTTADASQVDVLVNTERDDAPALEQTQSAVTTFTVAEPDTQNIDSSADETGIEKNTAEQMAVKVDTNVVTTKPNDTIDANATQTRVDGTADNALPADPDSADVATTVLESSNETPGDITQPGVIGAATESLIRIAGVDTTSTTTPIEENTSTPPLTEESPNTDKGTDTSTLSQTVDGNSYTEKLSAIAKENDATSAVKSSEQLPIPASSDSNDEAVVIPAANYFTRYSVDKDGIALEGAVPDDVDEEWLVAIASAHTERVSNELTSIEKEIPSWREIMSALDSGLRHYSYATATVSPGYIGIIGESDHVAIRDMAQSKITAMLPAGYDVSFSIDVDNEQSGSVELSGPAIQCQTQLNQIGKAKTAWFRTSSHTLSKKGRGLLQQVAVVLSTCPASAITIAGWADPRGPEEYNLQLSERRARSVSTWLAQNGVDQQRLHPTGRGETFDLGDGANNSLQRSRRVDFILRD